MSLKIRLVFLLNGTSKRVYWNLQLRLLTPNIPGVFPDNGNMTNVDSAIIKSGGQLANSWQMGVMNYDGMLRCQHQENDEPRIHRHIREARPLVHRLRRGDSRRE